MDDVQAVGWQPTVRHVGIAICTSRGRRRSAHTEPVAEAPSSPQGACGFAPLRHRLHDLLPRAEPGPVVAPTPTSVAACGESGVCRSPPPAPAGITGSHWSPWLPPPGALQHPKSQDPPPRAPVGQGVDFKALCKHSGGWEAERGVGGSDESRCSENWGSWDRAGSAVGHGPPEGREGRVPPVWPQGWAGGGGTSPGASEAPAVQRDPREPLDLPRNLRGWSVGCPGRPRMTITHVTPWTPCRAAPHQPPRPPPPPTWPWLLRPPPPVDPPLTNSQRGFRLRERPRDPGRALLGRRDVRV